MEILVYYQIKSITQWKFTKTIDQHQICWKLKNWRESLKYNDEVTKTLDLSPDELN